MGNELFERVRDELKALLAVEPYRSGARLPSERALSERFGVGRSTIREAVRALANQGLVETRRGSGTTLRADPGGLMRGPIEALLLLGESPVEDLYEAREIVEVHLAGRSAERRTDEDMAAILDALEGMRPPIGDDYGERNARFHEAIAHAGHNAILEGFMRSLVGGIAITVRATQGVAAPPTVSFAVHERIALAIQAGDSEAARAAMRDHMEIARSEWDLTRDGPAEGPAAT